jgi:hypothetical protein
MFDAPPIRDAKPIAILKKLFAVVIFGLLGIGAVSSYRAYVQVRSLELTADKQLTDGSPVNVDVISSGRTPVDVKVELIQGSTVATLLTMRVRGNELGFFDPRSQHASQHGQITSAQLKPFQTGAAIVRATAVGRPQWMRLPPPTVRELVVQLHKD